MIAKNEPRVTYVPYHFWQQQRNWDEVVAEWRRRSGEKITRQRACQIANVALRKIRDEIERDPELRTLVADDGWVEKTGPSRHRE